MQFVHAHKCRQKSGSARPFHAANQPKLEVCADKSFLFAVCLCGKQVWDMSIHNSFKFNYELDACKERVGNLYRDRVAILMNNQYKNWENQVVLPSQTIGVLDLQQAINHYNIALYTLDEGKAGLEVENIDAPACFTDLKEEPFQNAEEFIGFLRANYRNRLISSQNSLYVIQQNTRSYVCCFDKPTEDLMRQSCYQLSHRIKMILPNATHCVYY